MKRNVMILIFGFGDDFKELGASFKKDIFGEKKKGEKKSDKKDDKKDEKKEDKKEEKK